MPVILRAWRDEPTRNAVLALSGLFLGSLGLVLAAVPIERLLDPLPLILLIVVVLAYVVGVALELRNPRATIYLPDEVHPIRQYLMDWIRRGGKAVIFSKDLGDWVDEEVKELLRRKAGQSNLAICLPSIPDRRSGLVEELRQAGAQIVTYEHFSYMPKSRFTFIHFDDESPRLTIGRKVGRFHVNEEYGPGSPAYAVAFDLIQLLLRVPSPTIIPAIEDEDPKRG